VQTIELVVIEKERQGLKVKLNEELTKNKEYKDQIVLLEEQSQGMKEKTNEIFWSQQTPNVLIGHVKSLTMLENSKKLQALISSQV